MLGIIYVLLNFLTGAEIAELFLWNRKETQKKREEIWVRLPAAYGLGTLAMGWGTYLVSSLAGIAGLKTPLFYGNLVMISVTVIFLALVYLRRYAKAEKKEKQVFSIRKGPEILELGFFVLLFAFLTWIMFYVFYIKDGVLYSGFTVYGDYAPHTAMMRSFSRSDNFPTQYPHFGGEDVRYHFMFQFLAGNLEYLGLRLDFAYNLVSVLSLGGFLMLLYALAKRMTGQRMVGIVTVLLFFFRSAFTFFRFVWEHIQNGDLWRTLTENTSFPGYTPNEDWGLWNFNVYLNQRHLAFGLLLVALALWVYLEWVEAAEERPERGVSWLRFCFFTREAWKSRHLDLAVFVGMFLGLTTFWNGAAVIGGLLILAGFGLFSSGKLDYAVTAGVSVFLSFLQSRLFIRGAATEPSFYWGFLSQDKSLFGVLGYLLSMSGIFFVGLVFLGFFMNRKLRIWMAASLFPFFFAFLVSLTPDINVNHKYIMISYAFLAMLWAWAVVALFKKRGIAPVLGVLLTVVLTATGIYDFVVILKGNDSAHRVGVSMESDVTDWLTENLTGEDLLLTPEYSISEVTMSGKMLYLGWPYYAWSAGYDTNYRAAKAELIYTTANKAQLRKTVMEEHITYIVFEEGMEFEQQVCREDIIAQIYPLVYNSEDGRIRIYET